jgi:hypothetical protein
MKRATGQTEVLLAIASGLQGCIFLRRYRNKEQRGLAEQHTFAHLTPTPLTHRPRSRAILPARIGELRIHPKACESSSDTEYYISSPLF